MNRKNNANPFSRLIVFSIVCVIAVMSALPGIAQEQQNSKLPGIRNVRLPKSLGKSVLVRSPDFDGKVRAPNRNPGKHYWAQFEVTYQTTDEWLDELTFSFYVMTQEHKTKAFHFFQTTVTYLDIAKGEHGAAVMLPPAAIARYGEPISFGVEISANGQKIGTDSVGVGKAGWWTKLNAPGLKITNHSGYLQDRSKTPFGLTYIDAYEVVR